MSRNPKDITRRFQTENETNVIKIICRVSLIPNDRNEADYVRPLVHLIRKRLHFLVPRRLPSFFIRAHLGYDEKTDMIL